MQFWNHIITTSMIGTDKKTVAITDLPDSLSSAATTILENKETDKEDIFLQLASLAFNYRQCAVSSLQKEQVTLPPAPAEEKEYCHSLAHQVLKDILSEESIPLLKFWLELCEEKNKLVPPKMIASLFSACEQQKSLHFLVGACCGNRGEWLSRFNAAWNFSAGESNEELFQTGTLEQRKTVLKTLRKTDPNKARAWLQKVWPQEDATTKTTLLEVLRINIGAEDIPFLESLSTEKSKKVKDESVNLLKQIPDSTIIKKYQELIRKSVSVKKEKSLLNFMGKMVLDFQLPSQLEEDIFKSGIEKLSGQKNITDESFIFYQLISYIPPEFWEAHFNLSPKEIVDLFNRSEEGKNNLPALGLAAGRFKNKNWAPHIIDIDDHFYIEIISLLTPDKREKYFMQHITRSPDAVITTAIKSEKEWSLELTQQIFKFTAKNSYQYTRSFYNQHIQLIPEKIAGMLEKCMPSEEPMKSTWSNTSEYIMKLIQLKSQTIQSFN